MSNKISKTELLKKLKTLSSFSNKELAKLNFNIDEINYLQKKIINDKLGFSFNFYEKDEDLENNYFTLEEIEKLHIKPKDDNNNLIIEGDNYYALKAFKIANIKVDVIYIDPPYNTGNKDFIYNDDFVNKDDENKHSKWLSFMKRRLELAKELLAEDGVIFISIDDNEQAYLKILMDQIFGEDNFISNLYWIRNPGGQSDNKHIAKTYEFVLIYAKNKDLFEIKDLEKEYDILDYKYDDANKSFWKKGSMLEKSGSNDRLIDRPNLGYVVYYNPKLKKIQIEYNYNKSNINNLTTIKDKIYKFNEKLLEQDYIPIIPRFTKNTYGRWRMGESKLLSLFNQNKIIFQKKSNTYRIYEKKIIDNFNEGNKFKPKDLISFTSNLIGTTEFKSIFNDNKFNNPKPSNLIKYLINFHNNSNAIILDFFAGSGTTGQAVMELNQEDGGNRRFILVTNNENNISTDVCRERIYRVINGIGSKNEKIDWVYSDEIKSLNNNHVKYLKVKYIHKVHGEFEEINECKEIYKKEFNKEISIKDFIE